MAMEPKTKELIGLAAAIAGKCGPCFTYHHAEAVRLGIAEDVILEVIEFAKDVRAAGDRHMDESAEKKMRRQSKNAR